MTGFGLTLPVIGLAVVITLVQSENKPMNMADVYTLLEEHRQHLDSVNLRFADVERDLSYERSKRRSLEVKVSRLQKKKTACNGPESPVVRENVCPVPESYQIQLDRLKAEIVEAKQKMAQSDKTVASVNSPVSNDPTRLDDIENYTGLLMKRANQTDKTLDGLSLQLRATETLLRNSSKRLDAVEMKAEHVVKRVEQRLKTVHDIFHDLKTGLIAEKQRTAQANKAISSMKHLLQGRSSRLDAIQLDVKRVMGRADQNHNRVHNIITLHSNLVARVDVIERDCLNKVIQVHGEPSEPRDDQPSTAVCPPGTTVIDCRCSREDTTCDGVEVQGQQCTAWKSYIGSNPIQAHAKCAVAGVYVVIRDPLPGALSKQPLSRCPDKTEVAACWLHNWSTHRRYVRAVQDKAGNRCKVDGPCISHRNAQCTIHALCRKL